MSVAEEIVTKKSCSKIIESLILFDKNRFKVSILNFVKLSGTKKISGGFVTSIPVAQ